MKNGKASSVVTRNTESVFRYMQWTDWRLYRFHGCENKMPSEWNDYFIFSLFKGKGETIDRGN